MKKSIIVLFICNLILVLSCNSRNNKSNNSDSKDAQLMNVQPIQIKEGYVNVENNKSGLIFLLRPVDLKIKIVHERPVDNQNTFLSVAGAYTSKTYAIDGLFIEAGKKITTQINPALTGICVFTNNTCSILAYKDLNEPFINNVINKGGSLFQQSLLLKNGLIIECNLFGNSLNLRRAMVIQNDNQFFVVESKKPMTIVNFQKELQDMGIKDAVNLDMGSWSEGWYKNKEGKKIISGENRYNTHKQTNWIVYYR
jgi:hypothetical protein